MTDLDVDALLGALLLAEHAALAVAEEAPGAGRRRGDAEARGEGAQRGPHRHLVLCLSPRWNLPAVGRVRGLASTRRGGGGRRLQKQKLWPSWSVGARERAKKEKKKCARKGEGLRVCTKI